MAGEEDKFLRIMLQLENKNKPRVNNPYKSDTFGDVMGEKKKNVNGRNVRRIYGSKK